MSRLDQVFLCRRCDSMFSSLMGKICNKCRDEDYKHQQNMRVMANNNLTTALASQLIQNAKVKKLVEALKHYSQGASIIGFDDGKKAKEVLAEWEAANE